MARPLLLPSSKAVATGPGGPDPAQVFVGCPWPARAACGGGGQPPLVPADAGGAAAARQPARAAIQRARLDHAGGATGDAHRRRHQPGGTRAAPGRPRSRWGCPAVPACDVAPVLAVSPGRCGSGVAGLDGVVTGLAGVFGAGQRLGRVGRRRLAAGGGRRTGARAGGHRAAGLRSSTGARFLGVAQPPAAARRPAASRPWRPGVARVYSRVGHSFVRSFRTGF
jgi:hypothetical protein